jgi:hypothetical protein
VFRIEILTLVFSLGISALYKDFYNHQSYVVRQGFFFGREGLFSNKTGSVVPLIREEHRAILLYEEKHQKAVLMDKME